METGVLLFVKDNYWNIIVMQCFVILKKQSKVKTQTGFSAFYLFLLAMTSRSLKRKR